MAGDREVAVAGTRGGNGRVRTHLLGGERSRSGPTRVLRPRRARRCWRLCPGALYPWRASIRLVTAHAASRTVLPAAVQPVKATWVSRHG
ncbi:hypothetical protein [Ornithinimicrobium kibberense]|uniref:hypothetical protein n=1 Tax=Ornithinimicrobium kibberense TaxID=282060 RepID=UPI003606678C